MTITIKTRLNEGIYASQGGGEIRSHYEFSTGPRNLLKAIEKLTEHRADMKKSFGDIGAGSSWLEIDGYEPPSDDLENVARDDAKTFAPGMYSHIRLKTPSEKAKMLLDQVWDRARKI